MHSRKRTPMLALACGLVVLGPLMILTLLSTTIQYAIITPPNLTLQIGTISLVALETPFPDCPPQAFCAEQFTFPSPHHAYVFWLSRPSELSAQGELMVHIWQLLKIPITSGEPTAASGTTHRTHVSEEQLNTLMQDRWINLEPSHETRLS